MLEPFLQWATNGNLLLNVESQVLTGVEFMATGLVQWMLDKSTEIRQSSVHWSIMRTVDALA